MTRDNFLKLAQTHGLDLLCASHGFIESLIEFAALVAETAKAEEREACAKECEHTAVRMGSEWMAHHCAAAIRARGQA